MRRFRQWTALALTAVMLGTSIPAHSLTAYAADTDDNSDIGQQKSSDVPENIEDNNNDSVSGNKFSEPESADPSETEDISEGGISSGNVNDAPDEDGEVSKPDPDPDPVRGANQHTVTIKPFFFEIDTKTSLDDIILQVEDGQAITADQLKDVLDGYEMENIGIFSASDSGLENVLATYTSYEDLYQYSVTQDLVISMLMDEDVHTVEIYYDYYSGNQETPQYTYSIPDGGYITQESLPFLQEEEYQEEKIYCIFYDGFDTYGNIQTIEPEDLTGLYEHPVKEDAQVWIIFRDPVEDANHFTITANYYFSSIDDPTSYPESTQKTYEVPEGYSFSEIDTELEEDIASFTGYHLQNIQNADDTSEELSYDEFRNKVFRYKDSYNLTYNFYLSAETKQVSFIYMTGDEIDSSDSMEILAGSQIDNYLVIDNINYFVSNNKTAFDYAEYAFSSEPDPAPDSLSWTRASLNEILSLAVTENIIVRFHFTAGEEDLTGRSILHITYSFLDTVCYEYRTVEKGTILTEEDFPISDFGQYEITYVNIYESSSQVESVESARRSVPKVTTGNYSGSPEKLAFQCTEDEYSVYIESTSFYSVDLYANGGHFVAADGSSVDSLHFEKVCSEDGNGYLYYLPANMPVREGYVFLGWSEGPNAPLDENVASLFYSRSPSLAFYAVWKKADGEITLNPNGGYFITGEREAVTLPICKEDGTTQDFKDYNYPFCEDGDFVQWNTRADGTGDSYGYSVSGIVDFPEGVDSLVLYAIYSSGDGIYLTFDANEGWFNWRADNSNIWENGGSEQLLARSLSKADPTVPLSGLRYGYRASSIPRLTVFRYSEPEEQNGIEFDLFEEDLRMIPVRDGFTFIGWYLDKDLTQKAEGNITGNQTVYAGWTDTGDQDGYVNVTLHAVNHYFGIEETCTELTYSHKSGNPITEQSIPYTITAAAGNYSFAGLFKDPDCVDMLMPDTVIDKDTDIYVLYWNNIDENSTYVVSVYKTLSGFTYMREGEEQELLIQLRLSYGERIGDYAPAIPARQGFKFIGWYCSNDGSTYKSLEGLKIESDTTIVAQWEPVITVTFHAGVDEEDGSHTGGYFIGEDGTASSTITKFMTLDELYNWMDRYDLASIPVWEGYIFTEFIQGDGSSWNENIDDNTEELDLYASYTDQVYSLTLDPGTGYFANGEETVTVTLAQNDPQTGAVDDIYKFPFSENGYFIGWSLTEDSQSTDFSGLDNNWSVFEDYLMENDPDYDPGTAEKKITLYAVYDTSVPGVTFDANGGYLNWNLTVNNAANSSHYDPPVEQLAAVRSLSATSLQNTDPTYDASNSVLNTKYESVLRFTVSSLFSDGLVTLQDYVSFLNTTPVHPDGKVFAGWYADAECTEPALLQQEINETKTVYAKWEEGGVTVTLQAVGGYFGNDESLTRLSFKAKAGEPLPLLPYSVVPSSDFIMLQGLFLDEEGTQLLDDSYIVPEQDITIYVLYGHYFVIYLDPGEGYFQDVETPGRVRYESYRSDFYLSEIGEAGYVPTIDDDDKVFAGWYLDPEFKKPVSDDYQYYLNLTGKVLYARYAKASKVYFHLNGAYFSGHEAEDPFVVKGYAGQLIGETTEFASGILSNGPDVPYSLKKTFDGWYFDSACLDEQLAAKYTYQICNIELQENMDIHLYARLKDWPTVTCHANGHGYFGADENAVDYSEQVNPQQFRAAYTVSNTAGNLLKSVDDNRYKFIGWYTDEACTNRFTYSTYYYTTSDTDLYAKWEYYPEITLDANGGYFGDDILNAVVSKNIKSTYYLNSELSALIGTLNSGSVRLALDCWSTSRDGSSGAYNLVQEAGTEDMTLYAQYRYLYELTFEAAGGYFEDEAVTQMVRYAGTAGETRSAEADVRALLQSGDEYRQFEGWYSDPELTNKVTSFYFVPSEDAEYYAKYINLYDITFDANLPEGKTGGFTDGEGNAFTYRKVEEGTNISSYFTDRGNLAYIDDEWLTFDCWCTDPDGINRVNASNYKALDHATYYARWKPVYPITFDAGEGYFTVTDEDGNTSRTSTLTIKVKSGEYLRNAASEAQAANGIDDENLLFDAWCSDDTLTETVSLNYKRASEAVTYYAKYKHVFSVTYDGNGVAVFTDTEDNAESNSYKAIEREKASITASKAQSALSYDGARWYFKGWSDTADGEILNMSTLPITDNTTFYAVFAHRYQITFDTNGKGYFGSSTDSVTRTSSVIEGTSLLSYATSAAKNIHSNDPTAWAFDGWSSDPAGTDTVEFDNTIKAESDVTYYARWKPVYAVTFVANNSGYNGAYFNSDEGHDRITRYIAKGDTIDAFAAEMTRDIRSNSDNYEFDTWCSDEAGTVPANLTGLKVTGPAVYYAKFSYLFLVTLNAGEHGHFGTDSSVNISYARIKEGSTLGAGINKASGTFVNNDSNAYVLYYWCMDEDLTAQADTSSLIIEDTVLYARYRKVCHITFNANGGYFGNDESAVTRVSTVYEGASINSAASAASNYVKTSRPRSVFAYWTDSPNGTEPVDFSSINATDDVTYYAYYETAYEITADANGGTYSDGLAEKTYLAKSSTGFLTVSSLAVPSREGWGFDGWMTDEGEEIENIKTYKFTGDTTIKARWAKVFNISFFANGGTYNNSYINYIDDEEVNIYKVKEGNALSYVAAPSMEGDYVFDGWSRDRNGSDRITDFNRYIPTSDENYYARWKPAYRITFDANGGKIYGKDTYVLTVGENDRINSVPSNAVHENEHTLFKGWALEPDADEPLANIRYMVPEASMTFYAVWAEEKAVTINANGGYFADGSVLNGETEAVWYIEEKTDCDLSEFERCLVNDNAHTAFNGWYFDQNCTIPVSEDGIFKVTEDVTIYAAWTQGNTVTVYTGDGRYNGSVITYINVPTGQTIGSVARAEVLDQITFEDTDCYLNGWSTQFASAEADLGTTEDVKAMQIEDDMEIYAVTGRYCHVTVHANGGSYGGSTYQKTFKVKAGERLGNIQVPSPVGNQYYLLGLSTDQEGQENLQTIYQNIRVTQDTDLYAIWQEKLKVTLDANGGWFGNDRTAETLVYYVIPGEKLGNYETPEKEDGVFEAFFEDEGLTKRVRDLKKYAPTADVTFYAKWKGVYTVTLDANAKYGGYFTDDGAVTKDIQVQQNIQYQYVNLPEPITTSTKYIFYGWYLDSSCRNSVADNRSEKITENSTLYAKWGSFYTVTFDAGNGYLNYSNPVRKLTEKVVPGRAIEYQGHAANSYADNMVFMGWYADVEFTELVLSKDSEYRSYIPEGSTTLYALYKPYYEIVFDANKGSFGDSDVIVNSFAEGTNLADMAIATPTRDGFAFTGWYSDPACTNRVDFGTDPVAANKTYYAGWGEGFTVTFEVLNGKLTDTFRGRPETGLRLIAGGMKIGDLAPAIESSEDSYLDGWYSDAELTQRVSISDYVVTKNVTLYANVVSYSTITFHANGGFYDNNDENTELTIRMRKDSVILWDKAANEERYCFNGYKVPDGWYYDQELTRKVGSSDRAAESADLYLKWSAKPALILEQPQDVTAAVKQEGVTFHVEADGKNLTYLWYYSKPGSSSWSKIAYEGYKTDTLQVVPSVGNDGWRFKCLITDYQNNKMETEEAALYVLPTFVTQPKDCVVDTGETAGFNVKVTGNYNSYQWEALNKETGEWEPIEGQTTVNCSIIFNQNDDGKQVRCRVTGTDLTQPIYSQAATLYHDATIDGDFPKDAEACVGDIAEFHVMVDKPDEVTYWWYYAKKDSNNWSNASYEGRTTDTLKVPVSSLMDGWKFRCAVTYRGMKSVSSSAVLIIRPRITVQPSVYGTYIGKNAQFNCKASGIGLSYQWQYSDDGSDWTDIEEANNTAYRFVVNEDIQNRMYRCAVSSTNGSPTVYSEEVRAVVRPTIKNQPVNGAGDEGETVVLSVTAAGEDVTYQWMKQNSSGEWEAVDTSSAATSNLSLTVGDGTVGSYRCVVTDMYGFTVTSNTVKINYLPKITEQPRSVTAIHGETVTFTVTAEGDALRYRWQWQGAASSSWTNSTGYGENNSTLSVTASQKTDGIKYRCQIMDSKGNVTVSDIAKVTIQPYIKEQPIDRSGAVGTTAKFIVTATGSNLSYEWQYSVDGGTDWNTADDMAGFDTYFMKVPITVERDGYKYRCVITSDNKQSVTTEAVSLHVGAVIISQPVNTAGNEGDQVVLTVNANGEGLSYQWMKQNAAGEWEAVDTSSAATSDLSLTVSDDTVGFYHCVVGDVYGYTVTSSSVKVDYLTKITEQPRSVTAIHGEAISFTVIAEGDALRYRWQWQGAASESWTNATGYGENNNTLSVTASQKTDGIKYRCQIMDNNGNVAISNIAKVTIRPYIKVQPTNKSGAVGTTVRFSVTATGSGLSYEWQYNVDGGADWKTADDMVGFDTYLMKVPVTAEKNGYKYRCLISSNNELYVYTDEVSLIIPE